jgi:hypothetical protein
MRRRVTILLLIVLSFLSSTGWAFPAHGAAGRRTVAQSIGSMIERILPLDEPTRLILLGLLLIGLSVVVRRVVPGRRGR